MSRPGLLLILALVSLFAALPLRADPALGGLKPDLRLLIDISGSMKQSDPENLRVPALDLIVRLLPDGARAGVWIFGEEVEVLVPHGPVDEAWRLHAQQAIPAIDNSGQRTNIPAALAAATYDLGSMDPAYRTSIVLLTDGKVDVSESPMTNAGAARRLLAETAPDLGATGIPVHTIALSDEADWDFLRSLAQATSGIAEKARTAGDLTQIYLQSLEMVAPTERVPVKRREFQIDSSVREFTALVFFDSGDMGIGMVSPTGERHTPDQPGEGVHWFNNEQFALVTVSAPAAGSWRLEVPRKARIRVTVISDLQLDVDPLPNSMPAGKRGELGLRLREQGAVIRDPEVLSLFDIRVVISGPDGETQEISVSERYQVPEDGEYRVTIPEFSRPGRYQVTALIDGETLQRELPMYVEVTATPATTSIKTRPLDLPEEDLVTPGISLGGAALLVLALVLFIRHRRHRRRLELWQRRSRDNGSAVAEEGLVSGLSADDEERQPPA